MEINKKQKQHILIRYLNIYLLKKDLKMKNVLRNIVNRIEKNHNISIKQYNSIIKFIERESEFSRSNRSEIVEFFSPFINDNFKRTNPYGNDLTQFFR